MAPRERKVIICRKKTGSTEQLELRCSGEDNRKSGLNHPFPACAAEELMEPLGEAVREGRCSLVDVI